MMTGTVATQAAVDRAELVRALGAFAEPPGPAQARLADLLGLPRPTGVDWTEAFTVQLVPHAAIYLSPDGMLGGETSDRVAGFWRALHLPAPTEPDHLAALLGLYAALVDAERKEPDGARRALRRRARAALLHEYLLSWLPAYTHAMAHSGPQPYAAWARLLHDALLAENTDLGVPQRLPICLRAVPPVVTDGGFEDLLAGLFAPARSGVVLTRANLAATARATGFGLRLGTRRAALRALIEQDPAAVLATFAGRAHDWVTRHRTDQSAIGPSAAHWADRALVTADLLTAASHALATERTSAPNDEEPP